jgi:hypothetical protein
MSERISSPRISRRSLLRSGAAAASVAAGLPLSACAAGRSAGTDPVWTGTAGTGPTNVRVSRDRYGVHVEPSVAVNPRNPRQLLAACQVSPTANPEFIATYLSSDGGATWHSGGLPRLPAGAPGNGDDVTVAFDSQGRGYLCFTSFATRSRRGVYMWRTDDGGHSFSAPVTLLAKARPVTPADGVTYFQPNLATDTAGRVAVSAFALANGRVDQVLLVSKPRQLRFGPPLRVTTAPFDPHSPTGSGEKHGAWWIGDYQGIAAGAGAFHLMWNDTRTGELDLFAATVRP